MSYFTTRVELHGGSDNDYATLHAAMENQGFAEDYSKAGRICVSSSDCRIQQVRATTRSTTFLNWRSARPRRQEGGSVPW